MFTVTNYAGFSAGQKAVQPPNTPNLIAWYDFSDTSKLTTSGTIITTATDKSTSGFNVVSTQTQSGAANPAYGPRFSAAAQNGLAAADFADVGGPSTYTRAYMYKAVPGNILTLNFSFAAVGIVGGTGEGTNGTAGNQYIFRFDHNGGQDFQAETFMDAASTTRTGAFAQSLVTFTEASPGWRVYSGTQSSDATSTAGKPFSAMRIDGGQEIGTSSGTATQTHSAVASMLAIGCGFFINGPDPQVQQPWQGKMGEIRLFSSALGASDLAKEEGYLAWKWGLQGNLPANHPYKNSPP